MSVRVHDTDGAPDIITKGKAKIADAPLTGATASFTALAGFNTGSITVAQFTDPNIYADAEDFTATVTWATGDSSPAVIDDDTLRRH